MEFKYENGIVTITFPYDENVEYPKSQTGKSRVIASSNGFHDITEIGIRVNVNAVRVIPKEAR